VPTNVAAAAPETPAPAEAANTQAAAEVIQPVVVRQTIPPVPSGISGLGSPTASVKVEIGVDGKVVNASMQQPSHPLYDRLVLQAARDWLYSPALLNGRPVPSEKVVTIQLR
jgi:outer membrane biosynthesis protein TonB